MSDTPTMKCFYCGKWVIGPCVQVTQFDIDFRKTRQEWAHVLCLLARVEHR